MSGLANLVALLFGLVARPVASLPSPSAERIEHLRQRNRERVTKCRANKRKRARLAAAAPPAPSAKRLEHLRVRNRERTVKYRANKRARLAAASAPSAPPMYLHVTMSKGFLAPSYFCYAPGLDDLVMGKQARQALTLRRGSRSWRVLHMRGRGLSAGWGRAAADMGLALGDRITFTRDRPGELRIVRA